MLITVLFTFTFTFITILTISSEHVRLDESTLVNKQKIMKTLFLILLVPLLTHLKRSRLR